jgi:cysteine desulfurase
MKAIYLDYAATTPLDPQVADIMSQFLTSKGTFANPSSLHSFGQAAKAAIEQARATIACAIGADNPQAIIFTSGATEANNLALKGAAQLYKARGKHIITSQIEHKSVLDSCQWLEKQGFRVTYLTPQANGVITKQQVLAALAADTILVSLMLVNNELGAINDLSAIADETNARHILLHIDAVQAIGKLAIDVQTLPVDLLSMTAHKAYGPKGVGALYVRQKPRVRLASQMHGGGHEHGMRSGTLATHQIVAMAKAFELAAQCRVQDYQRILQLRHYFLKQLAMVQSFTLNTDLTVSVPHIINLRIDEEKDAKQLLARIPQLAASVGSACLGIGLEGSYVLRAIGLSQQAALASLRISFGRFTTNDEIDQAVSLLASYS